MALRADERRDKLRKASGRSKYPLIRRYLNGETYLRKPQVSTAQSISCGREPSELKHLSSRRKTTCDSVSSGERGRAQTVRALGVRTAGLTSEPSRMVLGKPAREGESPVHERQASMAGSRVPRDT